MKLNYKPSGFDLTQNVFIPDFYLNNAKISLIAVEKYLAIIISKNNCDHDYMRREIDKMYNC